MNVFLYQALVVFYSDLFTLSISDVYASKYARHTS